MENESPRSEHGALSLQEFIEQVRKYNPQATEESVATALSKVRHPSRTAHLYQLVDDATVGTDMAMLESVGYDVLEAIMTLNELKEQGWEVDGLIDPAILNIASDKVRELLEQRKHLKQLLFGQVAPVMEILANQARSHYENHSSEYAGIFKDLSGTVQNAAVSYSAMSALFANNEALKKATVSLASVAKAIREKTLEAAESDEAVDEIMATAANASRVLKEAFPFVAPERKEEAYNFIRKVLVSPLNQDQLMTMSGERFQKLAGQWATDPVSDMANLVLNQWTEYRKDQGIGAHEPIEKEFLKEATESLFKEFLSTFEEFLRLDEENDVGYVASMAVGKLTNNFSSIHKDHMTTGELIPVSGGKTRQTQHAYQRYGINSPANEPVELTEFDKRVIDVFGSFYTTKSEDLGVPGALYVRETKIVRQVYMLPPDSKVTERQKKSVQEAVDKLRHVDFTAEGTDYVGEQLYTAGMKTYLLPADVVWLKDARGNTHIGYNLLRCPPSYAVEKQLGMVKPAEALLTPRPDGYRPVRDEEISVFTALGRKIHQFRGSKFDHKRSYVIHLSELQEKVGGIYGVESIQAVPNKNTQKSRRNTFRKWTEKSLTELTVRGHITEWVWDTKNARGKEITGIKVWLPKENPEWQSSKQELDRREKSIIRAIRASQGDRIL